MKVTVTISLKHGVADPEGANTMKALNLLGFDSVRRVQSVRQFVLDVDRGPDEAREQVEQMCHRLLANPVVHDYRIEVSS